MTITELIDRRRFHEAVGITSALRSTLFNLDLTRPVVEDIISPNTLVSPKYFSKKLEVFIVVLTKTIGNNRCRAQELIRPGSMNTPLV